MRAKKPHIFKLALLHGCFSQIFLEFCKMLCALFASVDCAPRFIDNIMGDVFRHSWNIKHYVNCKRKKWCTLSYALGFSCIETNVNRDTLNMFTTCVSSIILALKRFFHKPFPKIKWKLANKRKYSCKQDGFNWKIRTRYGLGYDKQQSIKYKNVVMDEFVVNND